jgi:hypothetical protein
MPATATMFLTPFQALALLNAMLGTERGLEALFRLSCERAKQRIQNN